MSSEIRHDVEGQRFVAEIDGAEAIVQYRRPDEETIDLYRTYTPEALRGRGIAGQIVRAALDHAREAGLRVVPTCSYVAGFVERHPEYQDLVAD